jgi:hypothetical protein
MDLSSNGDENRKRARRKEGGRRGGVEWRTHHTTGRNDYIAKERLWMLREDGGGWIWLREKGERSIVWRSYVEGEELKYLTYY